MFSGKEEIQSEEEDLNKRFFVLRELVMKTGLKTALGALAGFLVGLVLLENRKVIKLSNKYLSINKTELYLEYLLHSCANCLTCFKSKISYN